MEEKDLENKINCINLNNKIKTKNNLSPSQLKFINERKELMKQNKSCLNCGMFVNPSDVDHECKYSFHDYLVSTKIT